MTEIKKNSLEILKKTNSDRWENIRQIFNPVTGEGSIGERSEFILSDFTIKKQYIPVEMLDVPLVQQLQSCGSIRKFFNYRKKRNPQKYRGIVYTTEEKNKILKQLNRVRIKYDFPYWAYLYAMILPKSGGDDIHFLMNRQQRRLIAQYESQRKMGKPIRLILAKSRQWGGSTATEMYIGWLQLVIKPGINSIIVGHEGQSSTEVENMYEKMIQSYPVSLLYENASDCSGNEKKWISVGNTGHIHKIPQRNCMIKTGTAERPNSARGGNSLLVHLTEVAYFKRTEGKKPEDIARSACAGASPNNPLTMIVYESSPNGSGNFFQKEYAAAKAGKSSFAAMFVPWWDIESYTLSFKSNDERDNFAIWLYQNRNNANVPDERHESGQYLWYIWTLGATLEHINWYII